MSSDFFKIDARWWQENISNKFTIEEEGFLIRLICINYNTENAENLLDQMTEEMIKKVSKTTNTRIIKNIRTCVRFSKKNYVGFLFDQIMNQRKRLLNLKEKRRLAGKKSGESRRNKNINNINYRICTAEPSTNTCSNHIEKKSVFKKERKVTKERKKYIYYINNNINNTNVELSSSVVRTTRARGKFQIPEFVPETEWGAYLQMRRQAKMTTTTAIKNLLVAELKKLIEEGQDAKKIINDAILGNWKSFYAKQETREVTNGKSKYDRLWDKLTNDIDPGDQNFGF